MNTTKLPFKKYTTMNNDLISKLGCSDVYRAYVLSLTADKKTNTTDTTIAQLASFINESTRNYGEGKTTKSFTDSLRDTGVVSIDSHRKLSIDGVNNVTRNTYTFLKGVNYRMIGVEFFSLDLDIKLKGYLLKLFSICNVNTLTLKMSSNEIYKTISVTKASQKKYNTILIERGLLIETENGLLLKVNGFSAVEKKINPTKETLEFISMRKNIIKSHIDAYNKNCAKKITALNRESIDKLKDNGLDKITIQYAIYFINGFSDVMNINKLVSSLEYGKKETRVANTEWATFTL